MRYRTLALVTLAAPLTLAACGSGGGSATSAPADAPAEAGSFTLASGASIDAAEFAGQDVLLWFWAPW